MNRICDQAPEEWIVNNIGRCRRAFYCTLGSSLYKTQLSPISLSKIFISVSIAKLLYGAEIRYYSGTEIEMYEQFQRNMARDIQMLPQNCPNPAVLATLGWKSISYQIDIIKLAFGHRIIASASDSIYRILFINRFYMLLLDGGLTNISPVAQFISTLRKYNLVNEVLGWLMTGFIPSKALWRKQCVSKVGDHEFSRWRLKLKMYRKLSDFRSVYTEISMSVWWTIARHNVTLKKVCSTMVRLVSGCSQLKVDKDIHVSYDQRICTLCVSGQVEDLFHMLIDCTHYNDIRTGLFNRIEHSVSEETYKLLDSLPVKIVYFILMGMSFPINFEDMWKIRCISCQGVAKMYNRRLGS